MCIAYCITIRTSSTNSPPRAHSSSASFYVIDMLDNAIPTNLVMLCNTIGHVINM